MECVEQRLCKAAPSGGQISLDRVRCRAAAVALDKVIDTRRTVPAWMEIRPTLFRAADDCRNPGTSKSHHSPGEERLARRVDESVARWSLVLGFVATVLDSIISIDNLSPRRQEPGTGSMMVGWGCSNFFLAQGAAATLAGCAACPISGQAALLTPLGWLTDRMLAAPSMEWPAADWWTAFSDPQLDALISEALARSPDVAAAGARVRAAEA